MKNGETLEELYKDRKALYEFYGDITVDSMGLTIEENVDRIIEMLKE